MSSIKEIAQVFADTHDVRFIDDFLRQILTPDELHEIDTRWRLVKMLYRKVPQRDIAKQLGISLCKITRGSRELKKKNNAFLKVLQKEGITHG